jgi:chitin disaccharide deacetylase
MARGRRYREILAGAAAALLLCGGPSMAQMKNIAERLGYPADSKLLIIHADDLGVAHAADEASFRALDEHAVTSASVMVPCPWLTEVAHYARTHPAADIGIHLTLTSEWSDYKWGPVAPRDQVPSLVDPDGYFYPDVEPFAAHAKPEEAEREVRAQIARAEQMGIHPTHLDIHMGAMAATPQLYAVLIKVGHEMHLPFMALRTNLPQYAPMMKLLSPNDIALDSLIMAEPIVSPSHWAEFYANSIRNLKPGLNEMIVHLGYDNAELEAITAGHPAYGAAWRQRDFNEVTSPQFKQLLKENHIILVGWKDLDKLVQ